jgi:hypothetical protein
MSAPGHQSIADVQTSQFYSVMTWCDLSGSSVLVTLCVIVIALAPLLGVTCRGQRLNDAGVIVLA